MDFTEAVHQRKTRRAPSNATLDSLVGTPDECRKLASSLNALGLIDFDPDRFSIVGDHSDFLKRSTIAADRIATRAEGRA